MIKAKIISTLLTILVFSLVISTIFPNLVSGKVKDGQVELNDGIINRESIFKTNLYLAPSQVVSSKELQIKNTGDYPLRLFEKFHFQLKKDEVSDDVLARMLDKYYVKAYFYKNGSILEVEGLTNTWLKASEFNSLHNAVKNRKLTIIDPDDVLTMKLDIKLDESANNAYQNTLLKIDYFVGGIMGVVKGGRELPNTATNSFNLLGIGLVIMLIGIALYHKSINKRKDIF